MGDLVSPLCPLVPLVPFLRLPRCSGVFKPLIVLDFHRWFILFVSSWCGFLGAVAWVGVLEFLSCHLAVLVRIFPFICCGGVCL